MMRGRRRTTTLGRQRAPLAGGRPGRQRRRGRLRAARADRRHRGLPRHRRHHAPTRPSGALVTQDLPRCVVLDLEAGGIGHEPQGARARSAATTTRVEHGTRRALRARARSNRSFSLPVRRRRASCCARSTSTTCVGADRRRARPPGRGAAPRHRPRRAGRAIGELITSGRSSPSSGWASGPRWPWYFDPSGAGAVGHVGRRGHAQEADLPDLHAGVERDRQVGHVRQLEGDVPVPTRRR